MNHRHHSLFVVAVTVLALISAALGQETSPATQPVDARLTIDASKPLQRIDGFGSSLAGGFEIFERGYFDQVVPLGTTYKTTIEQRNAIVETTFKELGLSHARVWMFPLGIEPPDPIPATMENWDKFNWQGQSGKPGSKDMMENRHNGIAEWGEFLKQATALGLVNWMPTPGGLPPSLHKRLNDPKDEGRFQAYAEWAVVHLVYLKKTYGLEPPYWSLYNEPDNEKWRDSAMYIKWITATGARFEKEGLKTKIVFPDFMNVNRAVNVAREAMADETARKYVGALAYHHYASSGDGPQPWLELASATDPDHGPLFDKLTKGPREMAEIGQKYGIPSWNTETAYYPKNVRPLTDWEVGRGRANEIYYEMQAGAAAVEGMFGIWVEAMDPRYDSSTRNEGHHILLKTDGTKVDKWYISKSAGAVFGHYGRFVRPGDRRLTAGCPDTRLRATAFVCYDLPDKVAGLGTLKDAEAKRYVAVVVNNAKEPRRLTIQLANVPAAQPAKLHASALLTDAKVTFATHPVTATPEKSTEWTVTLPPESLCTVILSSQPLDPALPKTVPLP